MHFSFVNYTIVQIAIIILQFYFRKASCAADKKLFRFTNKHKRVPNFVAALHIARQTNCTPTHHTRKFHLSFFFATAVAAFAVKEPNKGDAIKTLFLLSLEDRLVYVLSGEKKTRKKWHKSRIKRRPNAMEAREEEVEVIITLLFFITRRAQQYAI